MYKFSRDEAINAIINWTPEQSKANGNTVWYTCYNSKEVPCKDVYWIIINGYDGTRSKEIRRRLQSNEIGLPVYKKL